MAAWDDGAKAALIAAEPDLYFTTSHFDGYPAILCLLDGLDEQGLAELAAEAWACRAPRRAGGGASLPGSLSPNSGPRGCVAITPWPTPARSPCT